MWFCCRQFFSTKTFKVNIKKRNRTQFIDSLRLKALAGPGGMGLPRFGGTGGKGGDVILVSREGQTLSKVLQKNPTKQLVAQPGENSHAQRLIGNPGHDKVVEIPVGITVIDEHGAILGELNHDEDKVVVARGGQGGASITQFNGQKGESRRILLDLKLIADVGLVGFPNAGKSTLLKAVSRTHPKIADYPFTTMRPQIGTMIFPDNRQITVADLPGLIEGAHRNIGLGHQFLRHVERTKLLLFVVDINGFRLGPKYPHRGPLETVALLNKELELYREDLLEKPALLIVNKMDTPNAQEAFERFLPLIANMESSPLDLPTEYRPLRCMTFDDILPISAKSDPQSVKHVMDRIRKLLDVYADINSQEYLKKVQDKENERRLLQLSEQATVKLV